LREHIQSCHQNERAYKCPKCPKAFKTSNQRSDHKLLVHSGENLLKCFVFELLSMIILQVAHSLALSQNAIRSSKPSKYCKIIKQLISKLVRLRALLHHAIGSSKPWINCENIKQLTPKLVCLLALLHHAIRSLKSREICKDIKQLTLTLDHLPVQAARKHLNRKKDFCFTPTNNIKLRI